MITKYWSRRVRQGAVDSRPAGSRAAPSGSGKRGGQAKGWGVARRGKGFLAWGGWPSGNQRGGRSVMNLLRHLPPGSGGETYGGQGRARGSKPGGDTR